MIYFSSEKNPTLDEMRHQTSALSPENGSESMTRFTMNSPFKMETYAFHPDDSMHYFSMTMLAPDNILYAVLTKEEMSSRLQTIKLHRHDYYELMLVLEGEIYQIIENKRHLYRPGSCCLLNKSIYHTEEHSTDYRVVFLDIREEFLSRLIGDLSMRYFSVEKEQKLTALEEFLSESIAHPEIIQKKYIDFIPKQDNSWIVSNIHRIFEHIASEILNPQPGSSYTIEGLIVKLFSLLSDEKNFEDEPIRIGSDRENQIFEAITEIMIAENGKAGRDQLASDLHYSADYLNKICRKYSGMSLYDYGMSYCMSKAHTMLLETDMNIEDIALALGFSNRTNFYRQFRRIYDMTPAECRKAP